VWKGCAVLEKIDGREPCPKRPPVYASQARHTEMSPDVSRFTILCIRVWDTLANYFRARRNYPEPPGVIRVWGEQDNSDVRFDGNLRRSAQRQHLHCTCGWKPIWQAKRSTGREFALGAVAERDD
jgi:hypothetical protein